MLYLVNAILAPVAGFFLVFVFSPIFRISPDPVLEIFLEAYAVSITVYAGLVFFRMRSRPSPGLGTHCLVLGVLGFGAGTILFGYAAVGFVSVGHWLRQLRMAGPRCNRDGSVLVVYGEGSLACRTCSRVIKVGFDLPTRWRNTGFLVFVVGVLLYVLTQIFPVVLFAGILRYVTNALFVNGLGFLIFLINPQTMGAGRVRLPEPS